MSAEMVVEILEHTYFRLIQKDCCKAVLEEIANIYNVAYLCTRSMNEAHFCSIEKIPVA